MTAYFSIEPIETKEVAHFLSTERTVSPESYAQKYPSVIKGRPRHSQVKQLRKFVTGMPIPDCPEKRLGEKCST